LNFKEINNSRNLSNFEYFEYFKEINLILRFLKIKIMKSQCKIFTKSSYCYKDGKKYNNINRSYNNKKQINNKLKKPVFKIKITKPEKYFPKPKNNINFKLLEMSNTGIYSITKPLEAKKISNIIIQALQKLIFEDNKISNYIITDATSNVGGNTISFLLSNFKVNAIEIDNTTCSILKNNIQVYNINKSKYKIYCKDYTKIYKKLKQDIVFMDPPWGGPDYKYKSNIDLYLSNISIIDICNSLFDNKLVKLIVLKLPKNYNYTRLFKKIKTKVFIIHKIMNKNKYYFDICLIYQ